MQIVIIGGGLSGTLCAINLLRQPTPCSITLIEKDGKQLLKGAAYSSRLPHQLLNVPVIGMSLVDEQPDHFWNWIQEKGLDGTYQPHDFVPRDLFGQYINDSFVQALDESSNELRTIAATVTDIKKEGELYELTTGAGQLIKADAVILCNGNLPSQHLPGITEAARNNSHYIQNPWMGSYLEGIGEEDTILITGTGLTMVDQVMSLHKLGHKGKIHLLSRRGFLPQSHEAAPDYKLQHQENSDPTTAAGCLRWIRKEIASAIEAGAHWISVLNAIRDLTPQIWERWNDAERSRFLRHLKPYWETHRHRIPAVSYNAITSLIQEGKVEKHAGRIQEIVHTDGRFQTQYITRKGKREESIKTDWIINCTGPHANIRRTDDELIRNLLQRGMVDTDPPGIGLVAAPHARKLFIVGPPAKGTYWECTALREIRKHAANAVKDITYKVVPSVPPVATVIGEQVRL